MEALTLVNQPHPLIATAGRTLAPQDWRPQETVREVLLRGGLDPFTEIVVVVNDRVIEVGEWDRLCPQPGDLVHAVAALSGGGSGGSNPLRIVLSIAVMVAAFYVGPLIGAELGGFGSVAEMTAAGAVGNLGLAGTTWSALGSGLVSLAGNLVVGALFKPSTGAMSRVNGAGQAVSPTYSLSGGSNALRPYGSMPIVMGTHRVFPDYGAKPYTEFQGEDQYLYQIFNFGLSTVQISDLKIGDSPLANYSEVTLYWSDASGNIPNFPGNVDTESGGQLVRGEDWLQRTSAIDTVRLAVDLEGSIYLSFQDRLKPCTVRIEAQYAPAGTADWTSMSRSTVVTYTTGYWSLQTSETVYSPDYEELVQSMQHAYAASGHYEGETEQVNAESWWLEPIYGAWHWVTFDQATAAGFANDGPKPIYTAVPYLDIAHELTQKPRRTTLTADVVSGVYDVRVRLTSANSQGYELQDDVASGGYSYSFSSLRSYQEDTASYSGQKRLGMVIKASGQLSGVVQRLSALATASCAVYVSGAWRWQTSSNPAWWYLDFARGRIDADERQMYGCHLDDDQIDIAGIIAWAAFCDTERLSINLVLDSPQSAYDTLNDIARCGLASPSWASGKLGVVWDQRNASPVAAFGMSNILRGSFNVRYLTENLADEIVVSYIDSALDWTPQQIRKTAPGTVGIPQRSSTLEIKGCTNARLAGKHANIQAAAQYYRRRQITWETDVEGFVCQRGDVVILQHDLTQWGYSGRLLDVVSATLTLDREVPRSGDLEYVMLVSPDGTMQTWQIDAGTGDTNTLTLPEVPTLQSGMLTLDHRWFFSPLPTPGKRVKIVSAKPVSQYRMQLVATDDDPSFYSAWDGVWNQPAQNTLLSNGVPSVTAMQVSETLVIVGTRMISRVTLSFTVDKAFDQIYVSYRVANGAWVNETILENSITFDTDQVGFLEARANALKGVSLGLRFNGTGLVFGKTAVPQNVGDFSLEAINGTAHLSWSPATDLDVMVGGYLQIRYSPDVVTPDWSNAGDIGGHIPGTATTAILPLLAGTYLAKWVDSSGYESDVATAIVTDFASVVALNTVADIAEHPTFAGSKTSVAVDGSSLSLDSGENIGAQTGLISTWPRLGTLGFVASSGEYLFDNSLDLGSVQTSRVIFITDIVGYEAHDYIGDRLDVSSWPNVIGTLINDVRCALYLRTTPDDPSGSPTWSDWQPFTVGDYTARAFEFKAILSTDNPTHNLLVNALGVRVDMPDRIETGHDLVSGAALYHVAYALPFMVSPAIGITAQNMATGDYYDIANKLEDGFDITFRNSGGSAVSRTFDYISQAY